MRKSIRFTQGAVLAAGLASAASAAQAAHSYIPFTETLNSGGNQGLWLADTDNLGNPPYQLTNQMLDGSATTTATVAVLNDWTLNTSTRLATGVTPQLVVWGSGGRLYKANLRTIQPVQAFTNDSYQELCSLTALDERPYAAAKAYVQAVVEPMGSPDNCASGLGTQTWLIPASADNAVAPTLEPGNWSVIGAFTDPSDGSFLRWVVWTGNEVDAYKANFSTHTTLLVGPPAGPAPSVFADVNGDALLMVKGDDGVTHTDHLYHVSMTGSGSVAVYSYPDAGPCAAGDGAGGAVFDAAANAVAFGENTAAGYAVYVAPLSGAAPTLAYSNSSGSKCGGVSGDAFSGNYVGGVQTDTLTGDSQVIAVNISGPANQTPNLLVDGGANGAASIHYTIDGHFWIDVFDFSSGPLVRSTVVADGDGTVLQSYPGSQIGDDIWAGFVVSGPAVQRAMVYLFSPNGTPCTGGTLAAIDPAAFTATGISGVPADTCRVIAYGWQPASVGYFQEGTGSSPIEVDPVGGKAYQLLGTDPNGLFTNTSALVGYPFY